MLSSLCAHQTLNDTWQLRACCLIRKKRDRTHHPFHPLKQSSLLLTKQNRHAGVHVDVEKSWSVIDFLTCFAFRVHFGLVFKQKGGDGQHAICGRQQFYGTPLRLDRMLDSRLARIVG